MFEVSCSACSVFESAVGAARERASGAKMAGDFQVEGTVAAAPFTLKLHRGDGMCLLAMNWNGDQRPPDDFVGFAIEYREPGADRYFVLRNRLTFPGVDAKADPNQLSSKLSPIQKFRWVHFPQNAQLEGDFAYRVTPAFMNAKGELSYGVAQEAAVALARETYPGQLDVGFTRGFVSSQAFVDRFEKFGDISTLLPSDPSAAGLDFKATHPKAQEAYDWMGFEARKLILGLLDDALGDPTANVCIACYELNVPEIVDRLAKLGARLRIIIDDSVDKKTGRGNGAPNSDETAAAKALAKAGAQVMRQHMGNLQHNKFIVADGQQVKGAICGSTNFSWRGLFVQANNAIRLTGAAAIKPFQDAFEAYWATKANAVGDFDGKPPASWATLFANPDATVTFSPHGAGNAALAAIADDIRNDTTSSLLYSLAFLYQTPGSIKDAIQQVTQNPQRFVYGMSDRKVGGLDMVLPGGNTGAVYPGALSKDVPPPFSIEPTGGNGIRLHHKFVVIDFDKPTARVYLGSYNFSTSADRSNGENLLLIKDRRVATSYAVEALALFDHYHYRVVQAADAKAKTKGKGGGLALQRPPSKSGDKPWFDEDWTVPYKIHDRQLFA